MSGKALEAGIKEQDQLALHRCFLFLLRSSLRTPLMEQFAAAVDGGAPPDERTTAQAVALLAADAQDETQRREEEEATAAAEASGGRPLPVAVAVPLGSRAAPHKLRSAKGAGSARDVVGAAAETAEEKASATLRRQMRATVVSELKEMSGGGGGVAPLFAAVSAAAAASALPARSRRLLAMGVELATLHVEKKLAGRRAAKFNLALSLLPHKSIASLLQNTTPERAARSATALLLARPAGGPNLLQRLLAAALDIDKREAAYRAAARALPPAAQRAVAWLHDRRADHGLLPTAAAIDSAARCRRCSSVRRRRRAPTPPTSRPSSAGSRRRWRRRARRSHTASSWRARAPSSRC